MFADVNGIGSGRTRSSTEPDGASLRAIDPADLPSLSIGDVTLLEGSTGTRNAVFEVQLSEPQSFPVSVDFQTANGTAGAPGITPRPPGR